MENDSKILRKSLSDQTSSLDLKELLAFKTPPNPIIRVVYAISVLSSPADKQYKTCPKVQNMWSNIGKKDIEKHVSEFVEWLDSIESKKVEIAWEAITGLD